MASCWKVLDLEPTNDERAILRAYAKALKTCRPDENPEGFQRLVEAREQALQQARIVVQPVVQVNRLEDENLNEDEDAGNDDALPVITPPDVEAVEPIDTAPIAPQEPDPNEQLLEDVLKRLDETMSSSAPWSAPGRNVAAWIDLFDLAAGLDFNAMQRFRKVVASNLVRVFPDEAAAGDSDVAGLKAGTGILALAELIESECQFSWHGMRLASLAGTVGAERYFFWQARTKAACDLLARLAIPGLLKDTATGMPVLPEEDKPVLLVRKELKDYTDAAAHRARKPFSPDWLAMIFPVRRLFYYGMSREALGMLTLGGVLCLFLLRHSDMAFGIYGGLIAGYFALCAFLAYDIKWLGLKTMAGYVTRADRLHLLGSKRRTALAAANIISPKASFAAILEFLVFGCLLALLLFGFASHSTNRRFDVRSVPETLDGQMIELMEKTARGRFVPTSAFFNLLQDHLAQRANIDALGHTVSVNDVSPLEKSRILSTGSDIATLAGDKGDLRLMSLSLTVERAHKLEALLADYIAAPEQGRREIEQRLARWRVPILAAGGDYRLEAALWSVMPPRRDKDDKVVSIVDELRRAALISFIDRTQAQLNRKGIFDERGVIERLDRILTASGEELLNAARSFENGAVSEFSILPYVASDTAALPTDRMSSLLSANSDLADVVKGWAEPVLSWRIFATTVRTCLNLGDAGERAVINALIEPEIAAARLTGVADGTDLWAALTMKVTSEPACRAYLAGASPGNSTDSEKGSALGPQLGQLYGDNRVDEARRLARFMVGAASSKDFMWSTSDRGAVVLHWQRITEHQTAMAIEHIDQMSAGALDCPALALRGYALKSASEDRAARAEFVAALSAVQDDKCSSTYRNGLIFDVNQLRVEKKELEKKLAGGF